MPIYIHRRSSRKKRRKTALLGSCIALFLILTVYYGHGWFYQGPSAAVGQAAIVPTSPLLEEQARFWRSFFHIILNNDPRCTKSPDMVVPTKLDVSYESDHIHNRPDILWMDDADLQRLKISHQNFLNDIQTSKINLVYNKGTRGVVTTVSETQIPVLLIQLRMLRASGSSLPVEVFLSEATPFTDYICLTILPPLGATCVYLKSIFKVAGTGVDITSYQHKIFTILFSSFDEILLLDSDAWPISNPDHLFIYPPFTNTGLVLWPDFWYASESPYYFSIAKIDDIPPLHLKPATESGELMYAKSKHELSIALAAYYNHFGPEYYYPLQSQGAPGQGDKETFPNAALALKEDFYWVRTMVTAIGRMDSSGHFLGSAMVQYDPIVDFQHESDTPQPDLNPDGKETGHPGERPKGERPKQTIPPRTINKPMFIHANFPKFDPRTIFNENDVGNGVRASPPRDSNGTYVRCWDMTEEAAVQRFGYDVERRFWDVIKTVACEDLLGKGDMARKTKELEVCHQVTTYVKQVF